uniref:Small ribosomal subunit protein mS40 n=1 Tax=Theropithecus gelada TaxID=9565 RepID=A0A8D2EAE9_THEGE
ACFGIRLTLLFSLITLLHVDFRIVKLSEQFVSAHTGIIFHAPYTGVRMKQHKMLTHVIQKIRDHGVLSYHISQVEPQDLDFSASHGAMSASLPVPTLVSGEPWYPWYSCKQPSESELSPFLTPAPESMPKMPSTPPVEASFTEETGP